MFNTLKVTHLEGVGTAEDDNVSEESPQIIKNWSKLCDKNWKCLVRM